MDTFDPNHLGVEEADIIGREYDKNVAEMQEVAPMKLSETMEGPGDMASKAETDMMNLGLAQNICYLCGKEFKYRIQLKKHLSKSHGDDIDSDMGTIEPEGNLKTNNGKFPMDDEHLKPLIENVDDSKVNVCENVSNEEKTVTDFVHQENGVHDNDIGNSTSDSNKLVSKVTKNVPCESNADKNTVDIEIGNYNNVKPSHNHDKVSKDEKVFNANAFVANLNKNTGDSDNSESSMKFEEVDDIPNEVSDVLSNTKVTFTATEESNAVDANPSIDEEGTVVIGTGDMKYIRNRTDPRRLKYDCDICDKRFEFPYQLKRHTKIVHEGEYPYACDVCGKAFDRVSGLKDHSFVHSNERPHKCKLCDQTFKMKGNLKKHMVKHSGERAFKCEHCSRRFMLREQLMSHLVVHTGDKPFSCDTCGKVFARKTNLKEHVVIHSAVKKFPCLKCDKVFLRPYSRKVHMRNHMERKPHECTVCGVSFSQRCSLLQHVRRHTGERPFICPYCSRDFIQQSSLTTHVARHTGEKNYKCGICEKAFLRKRCLAEHIRVHTKETPFKCDQCDYASKTKNGLDRHRVKHSESKDFVCQICNKEFLRKRSFMNHSRIHTGERPYKCNVCPFATTTITNLNKHIRIHMKKMLNTSDINVKEFKQLNADELVMFHPPIVEESVIIPKEKEKQKKIKKSKKKRLLEENESNSQNSEVALPIVTKIIIKRKRPVKMKSKKMQTNTQSSVGTAVLRTLLQKKPQQLKEKSSMLTLCTPSPLNVQFINMNGIKTERPDSLLQTDMPSYITGACQTVPNAVPTNMERKPAMSSVLRTLLQKDKDILGNLTLVSDIVSSVRHVTHNEKCINVKTEIPAPVGLINNTSSGENSVHLNRHIKQEPVDMVENNTSMPDDGFDSEQYAKKIVENSFFP